MVLLAVLLALLALLAIRQLTRIRSWKRMASVDALTGVANRRGVDYYRRPGIPARAHSHGIRLGVLAIDLDLFKRVNDKLPGHPVGDRALQHIAHACQDALRERDLLGRIIGGEEFLVILPGSTLAHAAEVAEASACARIRSP